MKTILCPVDFSANSANAVKYAIGLNSKVKAKLILLHAFETPVLYSNPAFLTLHIDSQGLYDAALKKLKKFITKLFSVRDSKNIEMILVQGLASARICEVANEKKVDLIVMGTTGTHAGERLFIGSNASRVLRNAPCMTLLVPPKAKFSGFSRIVYATDLSQDNLSHASELFPLATMHRAELLFLHIDHDAFGHDERTLKKVTRKIKNRIAYPKKSGHVCTDKSVSDGISFFIKHHRANCLAVFTRHRSVMQEIYKPSISKRVSLHSKIPLLVIHENDIL